MTYNYTIYIYSYRLSNRVGGGRGVTGGVGSRAIARGEPGERDHTQHCSEHTAITLHTVKSTLNTAKSTLHTLQSDLLTAQRAHCEHILFCKDHTQHC